ncbi:MAG: hypothetical protein D6797_09210 [Bdellovibrio sp.]|nr:MAG: hypothetical protein D6797_09210 [Bdellovibrio sp.]
MRFIGLIFLFWNALSPAAESSLNCSAQSLQSKSCELQYRKYFIYLRPQKIHFDNKVDKKIYDFPAFGEGVEWKSARLVSFGNRLFLEIEVWGQPRGEAQVQDLKWVVYEITKKDLLKKIEKVVQKRKQIKKKLFVYDPQVPHYLYRTPRGHVKWRFDQMSGGIN